MKGRLVRSGRVREGVITPVSELGNDRDVIGAGVRAVGRKRRQLQL